MFILNCQLLTNFLFFSASSTDVTNPATSAIVNLENIQKIILGVVDEKNNRYKKEYGSSKSKSNKFQSDTSNGFRRSLKKYRKDEQDFPSSKGTFNSTN